MVKEKIEEKITTQAEGKAHSAETEKLDTKTQKAKRRKGEKTFTAVEFPVESRINPYGFIFMRKQWLADLGWAKGAALAIEKNTDGSITVRKA
jgi:hypothetical protein